ncbi:MAG: Glycosyl phosphatidyl inositol protein transamidase complex subunit [Sclerophora amabilis]|nr:MAG: Glycosyl phosphatidyl inositol protein transamidase complex subunit [Sclerophora amabilis]
MSLISPATLSLRHDPRILKLPPYLSALCIIVGVVWLLLLPLDSYSRQTYISENALLPGQVHTYFGGSEQNIFRAYRHEVEALAENSTAEVVGKLGDIFKSDGLKVANQKYEYTSSGLRHAGENVYSILHAPRGDATEAIVLVAAWRNMDGELNQGGIALVLTLARYFQRWSLWSKDIIFLITSDSRAGPQAWVDAYHDAHSSPSVGSLPLKSGALQGVVVVDQPFAHRFESIHIVYDGINGQLPNLDLFNTAVSIATGQLGIGSCLQQMWKHEDNYKDRLITMLRGMFNQGLGHASGPHSSFIPYHIDAITLQAVGDGWQDEMALGRTIESIFRSLNNLLEHFHQSFFFYLLMQTNRFVSIGTYLPSAMLIAVNFSIMAIALWVQSGRSSTPKIASKDAAKNKDTEMEVVKKDGMVSVVPKQSLAIVERQMSLPLAFVIGVHFLGAIPLYIFNHSSVGSITNTFFILTYINFLLPYVSSMILNRYFAPTSQQLLLIKSFSLLLLGMFLSALATVNFSLAFLIGLLAAPLTFTGPLPAEKRNVAMVVGILLNFLAPPAVLFASTWCWSTAVGEVLVEAAFGWHVWGMWTQVVVWCVWWPAWLIGGVLLASSVRGPSGEVGEDGRQGGDGMVGSELTQENKKER